MGLQPWGVEIEEEHDGRWLAEFIDQPGVLAYGAHREEAHAKAEAVALRVIADRVEHGEGAPSVRSASSWTARSSILNFGCDRASSVTLKAWYPRTG